MRALQPVPVGERSILPGRTTTAFRALKFVSLARERSGELAEGDVVPAACRPGMGEAELLIGGGDNADAGLRQITRFVRGDGKAERRRIDDDETVAAIGNVDFERAQALKLKRRVQPVSDEGTFSMLTRSALPWRHSAVTAMRPPGASSARRV